MWVCLTVPMGKHKLKKKVKYNATKEILKEFKIESKGV